MSPDDGNDATLPADAHGGASAAADVNDDTLARDQAAATPATATAIIIASILRVTGIPATEAQALRSKGDLYRAYQARGSAFVPWPPERSAS